LNDVQTGRRAISPPPVRPGRRKARQITLAAIVAAFAIATGFLFIWPPHGMPARVDAIVLLDGDGNRAPTALALAAEHRARYLVISAPGLPVNGTASCAAPIPGVRIICFSPSPATTQGEARYTAMLVRRYHWTSVAVVAIAPQDIRARIRFERCTNARIYVVDAPLKLTHWPPEIIYQWLATIKAEVFQRSC
jgi:hypothetical protein